MGYLFTDGKLRFYEAIMQLMPGFTPQTSAVLFVKTGKTAADCRHCIYSNAKGRKLRCGLEACPCFQERLEIGAISYSELLQMVCSLIDEPLLTRRAFTIIGKDDVHMFFHNESHQKRFDSLFERGIITERSSAAFISVLFLLTAENCMWRRAKNAVRPGRIAFEEISMGGLKISELDCYALFKAAKGLCKDTPYINIQELSDEAVVSDRAFLTIMNAFAIRRYGLKAIN